MTGHEAEDPETLAALRKAGIPADAIQRAVDRGDLQGAIFEAVLLPRIAERTVSAAEIEAVGGLSASELAALFEAFGLPAPAPRVPAFTPREAEVFTLLATFEDVWPADLRIRAARVYGRLLARIAHTDVQLFRTHVAPRLGPDADDGLAALRQVQSALEQWQPIADALLVSVHGRWLEHELAQAAVGQAEATVDGHELPGAVDVTVVFCDLKDFTSYADLQGDAAAVEAIESFSEIVTRERGNHTRMTKLLGDGVMLVYGDTDEAVAATARIMAAIRVQDGPDAHASIHRGVAVVREGDYFGTTINVAARLLALAGRHEMVATEPVALATREAFPWERVGPIAIRGVAHRFDAFRIVLGD